MWLVNAEQPAMRESNRDKQDMFLARTHPLGDTLPGHSDPNMRWRLLYEQRMETLHWRTARMC